MVEAVAVALAVAVAGALALSLLGYGVRHQARLGLVELDLRTRHAPLGCEHGSSFLPLRCCLISFLRFLSFFTLGSKSVSLLNNWRLI